MYHKKMLDVSDVIRIKSFAPRTSLQLSPNGNDLVYAVMNPSRRPKKEQEATGRFLPTGAPLELHSSEVWITDVQTGDTQTLSSDTGIDWSPRWSDDGRYLAFFSDRTGTPQLWIWDKAENKQRLLSEKPIRAMFGLETPQWTPDGAHIVAKLRPEREDFAAVTSPDSEEISIIVWQTKPSAHDSKQRKAREFAYLHGDLGLFNLKTGEVCRLAQGLYTVDYLLSPDGASDANEYSAIPRRLPRRRTEECQRIEFIGWIETQTPTELISFKILTSRCRRRRGL